VQYNDGVCSSSGLIYPSQSDDGSQIPFMCFLFMCMYNDVKINLLLSK